MNFPETEFTKILYAFINTPSIGGIIVILLALSITVAIFLTLRWIMQGIKAEETDRYTYPTSALHDHE